MPLQFIAIANPENRRLGFLQKALELFDIPPATIVNYSDLIAGRDTLEKFDAPDTIIRFDSPEKNFAVEKAIIAAGAQVQDEPDGGKHQRIGAAEALALEFDKGRILYPRQWYLGWRDLLARSQKQLRCRTMNDPADIAAMFDKPRCQQLFANNGIPIPRSLGKIGSYEELREAMNSRQCHRVFVKLAHGSSASGVVAYRVSPRGEVAVTTVERVRQENKTIFYNSRKIRTYTRREAVADIINMLCKEGVQVEEWLPKARLQNRPFDLRVVAIAGQARHIVVRLGNSPMTNLHLGSDRGDLEEFLAQVGGQNWDKMKQTCEAAAALFPNSLYCGIDLLVYPDFRQHAILEINAFGDLLPGITWNGMDTYASEVQAILSSLGCGV
ncbi:MAG: hypothetical protein F6J93_07180 [Oscillatoria sp. SIO1A7]|nr:hypothetical protein [Oscillatoria sp. SIO1A7]